MLNLEWGSEIRIQMHLRMEPTTYLEEEVNHHQAEDELNELFYIF